MMLSASACATLTARRAPANSDTAFCAHYPDAARPPVNIYDGDSVEEINQKVDLLIVWEVMCGVAR